ncbi:hypothetical protein LZ554_004202 [Drepanopeziza brunnea f. sp. 'monogermtubi']|nr:hypothetical protein LZ554_004202 [Drepanopeziza brunnea f. sp. 'monogermtubi']
MSKADVALHCGDLEQPENHDLSPSETGDEEEQESEREEHLEVMNIMMGKLAREADVTLASTRPGDWAFPYGRDEDRYNLPGETAEGTTSISENPIPGFPSVGIVMTHKPPRGILDGCADGQQMGCGDLIRAVGRARPRMHCFGHIHEGYGAEILTWRETSGVGSIAVDEKRSRVNEYPMSSGSSKMEIDFGKETLMVNAAIINEQNQPTNDPWKYDLDLETGRA